MLVCAPYLWCRLVSSLLQTVKQHYLVLRGSHLTTSDMVAGFDGLQQLVKGEKEVAWADQSGMSIDSGTDGGDGNRSGLGGNLAQSCGDKGLLSKDFEEMLELPVLSCVPLTRESTGPALIAWPETCMVIKAYSCIS